jgi:GAF domain-containing protein
MADETLRIAAAIGDVADDRAHRALLRSIVDLARAILDAAAASVFLHDAERSELVFEAVSGAGSADLVGRRFPDGTGIAGWVLASRQPILIDDLSGDPRFSREAAESTGYVPRSLMAVALVADERPLGVLQVLDPGEHALRGLAALDLLGLFANQAAIGLDLLQRARRASVALSAAGPAAGAVSRLAAAVDALEGRQRRAADGLLEALAEVLDTRPQDGR